MTDVTQSKIAQAWASPKENPSPVAPIWSTEFIWPAALTIGGVVSTFAWVTFLAWGLGKLFF